MWTPPILFPALPLLSGRPLWQRSFRDVGTQISCKKKKQKKNSGQKKNQNSKIIYYNTVFSDDIHILCKFSVGLYNKFLFFMFCFLFFSLSIPLRAHIKPSWASLIVDRDHKPTQQDLKKESALLWMTGRPRCTQPATTHPHLTPAEQHSALPRQFQWGLPKLKITITVGACD